MGVEAGSGPCSHLLQEFPLMHLVIFSKMYDPTSVLPHLIMLQVHLFTCLELSYALESRSNIRSCLDVNEGSQSPGYGYSKYYIVSSWTFLGPLVSH